MRIPDRLTVSGSAERLAIPADCDTWSGAVCGQLAGNRADAEPAAVPPTGSTVPTNAQPCTILSMAELSADAIDCVATTRTTSVGCRPCQK
jgi:hypothetical protein